MQRGVRSQDARGTPSERQLRAKGCLRTRLPRHFVCVRLSREKTIKSGETRDMTSRLETYRVQAYNTAKLSENKMHDDTVARRFGFSGGLVPGVGVMAYMMHLPGSKLGRALLQRRCIR